MRPGLGTRDSGSSVPLSRCGTGPSPVTLPVSPALAAEPQAVTFAARDGVQISAVLHLPAKTPAPAVVLLNMLGRTHRDWDGAAAKFVEAGIAVLAVDFRPVAIADPDSPAPVGSPYGALVLDAEAARAYLATRPEINPTRIGMAGASLGANVAVLAAANDQIGQIAGSPVGQPRLPGPQTRSCAEAVRLEAGPAGRQQRGPVRAPVGPAGGDDG